MARDLAAIFAADIPDYQKLKAEDRMAALKAWREVAQVFDDRMERYRGAKINIIVEASFLAKFPSALAAIACAVDLQQTISSRHVAEPALLGTLLRIGLTDDGLSPAESGAPAAPLDYHAARLLTPAEPGGICMSRTVYDDAKRQLVQQIGTTSGLEIPMHLLEKIDQILNGAIPDVSTVVKVDGAALIAPVGQARKGAGLGGYAKGLIRRLFS